MHRFAILFVLMVLFCAVGSSYSATIHVPSQQPTIQAGINAAVNGDTVLVAPGVYVESLFVSGKEVTLLSDEGPLQTILQLIPCANAIFIGNTGSLVMDGFTITGDSQVGSVVRVENSHCTVRNNRFVDISLISNLVYGDGVGQVHVIRNLIWNVQASNATLVVVPDCVAKIINNTIHMTIRGMAIYCDGSEVFNNILSSCTQYAFAKIDADVDDAYNCYWQNALNHAGGSSTGTTDVLSDPMFQGAVAGIFALHPNSPCINAGNPAVEYNDFDGSRNDIGAYGLLSSSLPMCYLVNISPGSSLEHVYSLTPTISWQYYDTSSIVQSAYEVEIGSDNDWEIAEVWSSGQVQSSTQESQYAGLPLANETRYWARIRVNNGAVWGDWTVVSFYVLLGQVALVPADYLTIQDAINALSSGDTVLVSPGTYVENISFSGKAIVLSALDLQQPPTLMPALSIPLVRFEAGEPIGTKLSGFRIMGGATPQVITVLNGAAPIIEGCMFYGYTSGEVVIYCATNNCTIQNNSFYDNRGISCVGIYAGSAKIINNTFDGNNRGFFSISGQGEARNNIVTNSADYGIAGTIPILEYNNVWNNDPNYENPASGGIGSISANPLYSNQGLKDYTLQQTSPCVNAGDPNPIFNDPDGSRNDMGAFPYVPPIAPPILVSIGPKSVNEGVLLSFNISATDANGTTPSLDVPALPSGAAFFDSTNGHGNFAWTPTFAQAGEYDILFIASDGDLADSEMVRITVQNVIRPPVVDSFAIDGLFTYQNLLNLTPQFQWKFNDPEALGQDSFVIAVGTDNDWQFAEKWNPAPFASADTFVTYDGSSLADGQTYYLRLRVHNSLAWSDWYQTSFRMNSVPSSPVLRAPTNLAVVGATPKLWVLNGVDAENAPLIYEFAAELATGSIEDPDIYLTGVAETPDSTGGQIINPLVENGHYIWRARGFDGFEYSPWTEIAHFLVNGSPEAPSEPTLTYPPLVDIKPIFSLLPTLSWQSSYDPDPGDTVRYKLELSDRANFSFALVRDSLLEVSLPLVDSLVFGTHYYWRVTAKDKTGLSAMSGVKEFWTWKLGDINHSHSTDLSDLSLLIGYLTQTPRPNISPKMVADLTGDCRIDLSDLSLMVAYMTTSGVVLNVGCE